jgi:hypothetical protein
MFFHSQLGASNPDPLLKTHVSPTNSAMYPSRAPVYLLQCTSIQARFSRMVSCDLMTSPIGEDQETDTTDTGFLELLGW